MCCGCEQWSWAAVGSRVSTATNLSQFDPLSTVQRATPPLAGHEVALTFSPPRTPTLIFSRLPSGKPSHLILHEGSRGKCSRTPLTQIYHPPCIYLLSISAFTSVTKERGCLYSCEAVFLIYLRNLFRLVFLILTSLTHCLSDHKLHRLYILGIKEKDILLPRNHLLASWW